jgi:23S rRNA maturation-related 3'-5' exoribonuclease YhaM
MYPIENSGGKMKPGLEIFTYELNQIKDTKIKEFTIKALEILPDYFWKIPASVTGKHHPKYALGEGGLSRHVKAAVRIALELFNLNMFKFNDTQKDIIISALFLHDGAKSGIPQTKYTIHDHPLVITKYIREHKEVCDTLDAETLNTILGCIESHMGQWTTNKFSKVVLPEPKTSMQKITFLCDYLASRKCLEMNFDTIE